MASRYSPTLDYAQQLAHHGQIDQARAVLVDLLRRDPDAAEAWLLLAQWVTSREEAAYCLREVLRLDPGDRQAAHYLALIEPKLRGMPLNPLWRYQGTAGAQPAPPPPPARRSASTILLVVGSGLILVCLIVVIALVALSGATGQEIAALLGGATPTWEQTKPSLTPTLTQTLPVKLPAAATLAGTLTITPSPTPLPTHTLLPSWTPLPTSTPRPTDPPTISAPPTASSDDIDVRYETEYYIFGGTTTADIQNAINTQGPIDNNGQRAIALTSSNIGVSWRMAQSTAGCQLQEVEVKVDITFLYPQWQPETTPDPALLAEWDRFIQHVEAHEQHHAEISLECSEDLLARVQALSQTDSCSVFEANVRAINDQVTEECDARQQAYDDVEGYASFPLP